MARVTVEACLEREENRFALVILAAHRTRQLMKGAHALVPSKNKAAVTALREIGTLSEPKALSGWLLKIAVHQAHRRIRRERLLRTLGFGRGGDDEWLAAQARGDLSSEARAELVLLGRSLRGLSATDRIAWTLRWVEDLSLEEVADACGCSLATAKRRIAAAEAVVGRHFAKEGSS